MNIEIVIYIVISIIGFIISMIWFSFKKDFLIDDHSVTSFILALSLSLLIGLGVSMVTAIVILAWKVILFIILPILIISYIIFRSKDVIQYFKNIKNNKKSQKIIKDTTEDIKIIEIAKQVYDNLRKDFPDITFESVLENVKSKF